MKRVNVSVSIAVLTAILISTSHNGSAQAQAIVAGPTSPTSQLCADYMDIYPRTDITSISDGHAGFVYQSFSEIMYTGYGEPDDERRYTLVLYSPQFQVQILYRDSEGKLEPCWTAKVNWVEGDPGRIVYRNGSICYRNRFCRDALLGPQEPPKISPVSAFDDFPHFLADEIDAELLLNDPR